jgi:hypothetical protein
VGAGVGAAAAAVGLYLLITSDDPRRYERAAIVPSAWIDPAGAGASVSVRF